jgi:hypothetical protein
MLESMDDVEVGEASRAAMMDEAPGGTVRRCCGLGARGEEGGLADAWRSEQHCPSLRVLDGEGYGRPVDASMQHAAGT